MSSTTTLRSDPARTGTNPNFAISTNPWRKISVDLGTTKDHFGDFHGILLETETGARHEFSSREQAIHDLAETARLKRSHLRLTVGRHHRDILRVVILRRPTRFGCDPHHGR